MSERERVGNERLRAETAEQQRDEARQRAETADAISQSLRSEKEHLRRARAFWLERAEIVEKQLADMTAERDRLTQERDEMGGMVDRAQDHVADARQELADANRLIENLRAENKRLHTLLSTEQRAVKRIIDENRRLRSKVNELVTESLETDYTKAHECGTTPDDADAYEVAVANVREMHRLLDVRAERLLEANDERNRLRREEVQS